MRSLRFFCFKCGQKLQIECDLFGHKFSCPTCSQIYLIDDNFAAADDRSARYMSLRGGISPRTSDEAAALPVAKVVKTPLLKGKIELPPEPAPPPPSSSELKPKGKKGLLHFSKQKPGAGKGK